MCNTWKAGFVYEKRYFILNMTHSFHTMFIVHYQNSMLIAEIKKSRIKKLSQNSRNIIKAMEFTIHILQSANIRNFCKYIFFSNFVHILNIILNNLSVIRPEFPSCLISTCYKKCALLYLITLIKKN